MTDSKSQTILCHEVFDDNSHPSEEEVLEYAVKIGIDPKSEPQLLPIAKNGLMQALPTEWKPCFDSSLQNWYYFNTETGNCQWEHPLDPVFRDLVKRGRSEGYSSAGDETTAKEDLKSFEEVSDLVSSKSDLKPANSSVKQPAMEKQIQQLALARPLLTRRKQLQQGNEPLKPTPFQAAKLMNTTLQENRAFEQRSNIEGNNWKTNIVPLRRAHTLDPIPDSSNSKGGPMMKGILRDTSFPGAPQRSLARLEPMSGEYSIGLSDIDDEKKRSVRFADFELKALDIKFNVSDSEESIYGVDNEGSGSSISHEEVTSEGCSHEGVLDIDGNKKVFNEFSKVKATPIRNITFQKAVKPKSDNKTALTKSRSLSPFQNDRVINKLENPEYPTSFSTNMLDPFRRSVLQSEHLFKENKIQNFEDKVDSETDESLDEIKNAKKDDLPHPLNNKLLIEGSIGNQNEDLNKSESTLVENNMGTDFQKSLPLSLVSLKSSEVGSSNKTEVNGENKLVHGVGLPKKTSFIVRDVSVEEMEEMAKKKATEKLAVFQDRLTKDIQDKINFLKQQQMQILNEAKETIKNEEEKDICKLKQEKEERIKEFQMNIEKEECNIQNEIRKKYETKISKYEQELEIENEKKFAEVKDKLDSELQRKIKYEEERFCKEKSEIEDRINIKIQSSTELIHSKLAEIKSKEEMEIQQLAAQSLEKIEEAKKKHEIAMEILQEKNSNALKKIEDDKEASLKTLEMDKALEVKTIQTEWEDKITAAILQYKATLECAISDHEKSIGNLRLQFQKQEEEIKKRHSEQIEAWNLRIKRAADKETFDFGQISRDFEKMRCEKRLLEDKYRSLKEKYVQMKNDMRIAVERKIQSKARRKREEIQGTNRSDNKEVDNDVQTATDNKLINYSSDLEPSSEQFLTVEPSKVVLNRMFMGSSQIDTVNENCTDNDPSSTDDQYNSLSSTQAVECAQRMKSGKPVPKNNKTTKSLKLKFRKHNVLSGGSILDNVRTQLQELDEIEEKIPATAHKDTYVRYPFLTSGTSAEVDFYRHRVLVEQEAVRAARECLLQQKRDIEARQNLLRSNTTSSAHLHLQQQEHDLTEMEVSIHRTRALLGEKMIRLRLLGQTLDRLVQDSFQPPSQPGSISESKQQSGDEALEMFTTEQPYNVLKNLENINSEIREIWEHLQDKSDAVLSREVESGATERESHHVKSTPTTRRALESRLNALKEWLEKPPPLSNTWTQLTL